MFETKTPKTELEGKEEVNATCLKFSKCFANISPTFGLIALEQT